MNFVVPVDLAVVAVESSVLSVEGVTRAELDVLSVAVEERVHRVVGGDFEVLRRVRYARGMRGVRRRESWWSNARFNTSYKGTPTQRNVVHAICFIRDKVIFN